MSKIYNWFQSLYFEHLFPQLYLGSFTNNNFLEAVFFAIAILASRKKIQPGCVKVTSLIPSVYSCFEYINTTTHTLFSSVSSLIKVLHLTK